MPRRLRPRAICRRGLKVRVRSRAAEGQAWGGAKMKYEMSRPLETPPGNDLGDAPGELFGGGRVAGSWGPQVTPPRTALQAGLK